MKTLFITLISLISLTSCEKKNPTQPIMVNIVGDWEMTEAKYSHMSDWHELNEPPVTITSNHISEPWNKSYVRINNSNIIIDNVTPVQINPTATTMLWVSNGDSLRFVRL